MPVAASSAATSQKSKLPASPVPPASNNTVCLSTLAIAVVTQPMTIEFMMIATYSARKPRRKRAGPPA